MRWRGLVLVPVVLLVAGCAQDSVPVGTERGPCYRNHTCLSGLVCLSDLCVRLPEGGLPFEARVPSPDQPPPMPPPPQPWDGFMPPPPGWDGFMPPPPGWDGFMPPPKGDGGKKPPTKDGGPKPVPDLAALDLSAAEAAIKDTSTGAN